MDDRDLKNSILEGREDGITYLIDSYGTTVNSFVRFKLESYPDYIDECVNDVFVGVWQNIDQYNPDRNSLKNWVMGVARYKVIDYLRKIYKEKTKSFTSIGPEEIVNMGSEDKELRRIEESIEDDLSEILLGLKPLEREIIIKKYIYGQTVDQIANQESMSKKSVYNRLFYAKTKIRNRVEKNRSSSIGTRRELDDR